MAAKADPPPDLGLGADLYPVERLRLGDAATMARVFVLAIFLYHIGQPYFASAA